MSDFPKILTVGRLTHKQQKRDVTNTGNGERGTGNGERGTGNRERESGNECTAVTRLRIQNGGQNKKRGPKNQEKKQFKP